MSAHNPAANRRTDRAASELHADSGQVSTRILLDSSTRPTCEACGKSIELKCRHKCLTVRDGSGTINEFIFCSETCLSRQHE
ncbi:DUF7576 family protein [Halovenus rubra]|uniref:DUF7576 family protein n=1 Tax=Halovenus rubra TaxID=869890 RepID=UPI003F62FDF6